MKSGRQRRLLGYQLPVAWAASLRRNPFIVHLREQQPFLQSVIILSNEFLKSKGIFTIIYKAYILFFTEE